MDQTLANILTHLGLLAAAVGLGFGAGGLTGLFGAGGGFILTPALNILLGVPMNLAVGTGACQIMGAAAFSLYHHRDPQWKGIRVALSIGLGIPVGSFLGAAAVDRLKRLPPLRLGHHPVAAVDAVLLAVFAVLLLLVGLWMLWDNAWRRRHHSGDDAGHAGMVHAWRIPPLVSYRTVPAGPVSLPLLVACGLLVGVLSGLLGIGGGVVMVPVLYYIVGQDTKAAAKTSTMLVFAACLFATLAHARSGNIDYGLALCLLGGAFFGTSAGAAVQRRTSGKNLRQYFAFVVLGVAAVVIWKLTTFL